MSLILIGKLDTACIIYSDAIFLILCLVFTIGTIIPKFLSFDSPLFPPLKPH